MEDAANKAPAKAKRARMSATEIADGILRLIDAQKIQPGDRLREQEIADLYGVSRGPVREAFRILQARTAIRIEAMRGATVIRMSDEETVAAVEMSGVLFGLAARRACDHVTAEDVAKFRTEAEALSELAKGYVTPKTFYRATLKLGGQITRAAGSAKLEQHLADVRVGAPNMFGPLGFISQTQRETAASRWIALVDALEAGDAKTAESLGVLIHTEACENALAVGL